MALRSDGVVLVWGDTSSGRTTVPAAVTNVAAIAAGGNFNLALTDCEEIEFSQPPASGTVVAGDHYFFKTAAVGPVPLNFQWQFNGTNLQGATNSWLAVMDAQAEAAGDYTLVATHDSMSVTSQVASLTVVASAPQVVSQASTNVMLVGAQIRLAPELIGSAPLACQWQINNVDVPGATNETLELADVRLSDAGDYRLILTNVSGSVTGLVATLNVRQVIGWGKNQFGGLTNVPTSVSNVTKIDAGYYAVTGIKDDGSLVSWGASYYDITNIPAAATNIVAIGAGYQHTLALRGDGSIIGWGDSAYGKTTAPASASNVTALAGGNTYSVALREDGSVVAWGWDSAETNIPVAIYDVMLISASKTVNNTAHNLAVRRDGAVVGWGYNTAGRLDIPATATNCVSVAAGGLHSLALRADGTIVGWGSTIGNVTQPPPAATNVVAIAAGDYTSMALRNDGKVFVWGSNNYGQTNVPNSVDFAVGIAANSYTVFALGGSGAPRFVDSLGNLTAYVDGDFRLNALAVGRAPLSYQWRLNGQEIHAGVPDDAGKQPTLLLPAIQYGQAGEYSVVVSNALGVVTGVVANVSVELPRAAPVVVQDPQSQAVFAGTNVSFSAQVTGNPSARFQWQFNSANIPGATNSVYTINYALTNQAGNYRLIASNAIGMATSQVATLTVELPSWPVLNSWPTNRAISAGAPVSLSVAGIGTEPISYQWQLNGTNLSGVTGPSLTLGSFALADSGNYRVVVSNQFGVSIGPEFTVVAIPVIAWGSGAAVNLPFALTNAVAIAAGYQHGLALKADGTVAAWGTNSFTTYSSYPYKTVTYQITPPDGLSNVVAIAAGSYQSLALKADGTVVGWGVDSSGQSITVPPNATNIISIAAGSSHSIALRGDGTVLAWGSNSAGETNVPANATNVVAIAAHANHNLALRADGTVVAWGNGSYGLNNIPASVANGVAIAAGADFNLVLRSDGSQVRWGSYTSSWSDSGGATAIAAGDKQTASLTRSGGVWISGVSSYDPLASVPAWCADIGAVAAGGTFTLALQPPADGLPSLQTTQRFAWAGGRVVFAAFGPGQRIAPCQWRINGTNLPGAGQPFLTLDPVQFMDAGDYDGVISAAEGTIASGVTHLNVAIPPVPQITQQPASQTVGAAANATFTVASTHGIPVGFQWQFNGADILGATNATLNLRSVQAPDAGQYRVVLTNYGGAITSQVAMLTVTSTPPTWVISPQSQCVAAGLAASLTAQAIGSDPIAYQWQFNGTNLSGENGTSLLIPMNANQVGAYSVVASNAAGSATNTATLALASVAAWGDAAGQTAIPLAATNLLAVAAGGTHRLGLRADGTVIGWGENACGSLDIPSTATNVVRIAAGEKHSLALRADGTVLGWGNNVGGQAAPPAGLANVVEIAAGFIHSLALKADGTVTGWGYGFGGAPEVPVGLSNVVEIAAGGYSSLALKKDGSLTAWGVITNVPAQATNVIAIASGFAFNVALRADGTPVAWGQLMPSTNLSGSLSCSGYGLSRSGSFDGAAPIEIPAPATNIVAIAAGRYHIVALRADGALIAWGENSVGQTNAPILEGIIGIAAGGSQSLALIGPAAPRVGIRSSTVSVGEGSDVSLNFAVAGAPPLAASWQFNNTNLSGANNYYCFIPTAATNHSGDYALIVTNQWGAATGTVSLTITSTAPTIVTQPVDLLVSVGSNAVFTASVAGTQPLGYQWQRDGTNLLEGAQVSGSTTPMLTLLNVQTNDTGTYRLIVTNVISSAISSNAALTVLPGEPLAEAVDAADLVWTSGGDSPWHFQTQTNHDGADAAWSGTLSAPGTSWIETTVTGPIAISFWWKFSATFESFSLSVDGTNLVSTESIDWQQRTFAIPSGTHAVRWTAAKTISAAFWPLNAWLDQVSLVAMTEPLIVTQPASVTNMAGADVTFSVAVTGTEPFSYQWQQDGTNISGANNATLVVRNIQAGNTSQYRVVITNAAGTATSQEAGIAVIGSAPVVKSGPVSAIVCRGLSAEFSAGIRGTEPMALRWQMDRADIPGASNSSLVISNVQPADAGVYRVVASNPFGTTFSSNAVLAVVPVATWGRASTASSFGFPVVEAGSSFGDPNQVPADVGDVVAVSAGYRHNVALRRDGSTALWGSYPMSGVSPINSDLPVLAVASAGDHDIALLENGTVAVWGSTVDGLVNVPAGLANVVAVAAGNYHNLALKDDGTVAAWGQNTYGQTDVPPDATNLVAVAGGMQHSVALREDGTVLAWGTDDRGQLAVPANLSNVVAITAGAYFNLALRENGTVVAWGDPQVAASVPGDLTNIVAVASGEHHALALRADGTVVAWVAYINVVSGTYQATIVPTGLSNVVALAGGYTHSLAVVGDGRPVITVQPFRRKLVKNGQTRLQVMAVGAGTLSYQWQLNGTNLPGANQSFLVLNQTGAPGNYSVIVSNALGTVTSGSSVVTSPLRFLDPPEGMKRDEQGFHLRLSGLSGKGYVVIFASTNVTAWRPIFTNIPVVGVLDYIDSDATNFATRFYRATESELSLGRLRFTTPVEFLPTTNGSLNLRIEGASGLGPVILYGSTNLLNWEPLATNPPAIGTGVFHPPVNSERPAQFFKVSEER